MAYEWHIRIGTRVWAVKAEKIHTAFHRALEAHARRWGESDARYHAEKNNGLQLVRRVKL